MGSVTVLKYLKENKNVTTKELIKMLGIPKASIRRNLRRLVMEGHIKRMRGWKYIGDDKNENE